jgi:hypothetical protein
MQMSGVGSKTETRSRTGQQPDIIKKQEGLGEKMKDGMKKGDKPGEGQKDKTANKAKQVSLDKKVRVVKGMRKLF